MVTLIIGLPSTGKTSYAKNHLRGGLCYDLDYLASAFRLRNPHDERHDAAIRMANDIAFGFYRNAREYADNIIIIRAAPSIEELEEIKPDKIIVMRHEYQTKRVLTVQHKRTRLMEKIYDVIQWASNNNIPLEYPLVRSIKTLPRETGEWETFLNTQKFLIKGGNLEGRPYEEIILGEKN